MTKNNLVKKILSGAKNIALGTILGASLIYSNKADAQKPEEPQEFGTAIIGGKPATVSLSEYFGTSYLSVPVDDKTNELGREFYPFLTLRGVDAKGKDTTNIVSWKSRGGVMEDLKSEVTYVPKKIEGKYLIQLMNIEDSPTLGIEITDSKTTKDVDAISGKVDYESGKIEDLIRTVKFPSESEKYFLFYRDHVVDSGNVLSGKKTPFVLVRACGDKEPIYFTGKNPFFEGEIYEFVDNGKSDLTKIVDKDKKSLIYSENYLNDKKAEIAQIRANDRTLSDANQKRGIPGHVKELLEGKVCGPAIESEKPKTPSNLQGRIKLGAGFTIPKGYAFEINPQVQLDKDGKAFLGFYGSFSNSSKSLENITQEEPQEILISKVAGLTWYDTGKKLTETRKAQNDFGLGLNLSYVPQNDIEFFIKAGLLSQKIKTTLTSEGEQGMKINGVKDTSSIYSYNESNDSIAKEPLFNGAVYVGAGAEYLPFSKKTNALKNLAVYGEIGYVIGKTAFNSMPFGALGIKYNLRSKPKNKNNLTK